MTRIAIASSDDIMINCGLDSPGRFLIYQLGEQGNWMFLGERNALLDPARKHRKLSAPALALLLRDTGIILAASVSKETARFLKEKGILAFAVPGEISRALESYRKRGHLLSTMLLRTEEYPDICFSPLPPEER